MSALTHGRPSRQQLVTSILLLAVIFLLNYAGAQTEDSNTVVITLSRFNITRRVVTVNLGDTVVFQCTGNFSAEIVQQTEAQLTACDNSVNNINNEVPPVRISACLGEASETSIPIETASEMLQSSRVFEPGNSYYYTSYSFDNLTAVSAGLYGRTNGGLCSAGFKLELRVSEEPTSPPTSSSESQATADASTGTTGNVDNGNTDTTIGGPGVDEPTDTTPSVNVGGLNSAYPVGSSSVSFITTVSVLLCALLSKFLY